MNGDVLKKVFLIIVITMCGVLGVLTIAVLIGKFPINDYEKIMEIIGIPSLLSMIITSFIHSNIKEGDPNATTITTPVNSTTSATVSTSTGDTTTEPKS